MALALSRDARAACEAAPQRGEKVRNWRQYRAMLLREEGAPVAAVAAWTAGGRAGPAVA